MNKLRIAICAIVMLMAFFINAEAKNNEKSFVDETFSENLKSTKITPVMDTFINTNENLIYCSTFQMAWNELCNKYAMGTLEIKDAPDYVEKLNELYKQKPLLDEDSYLAMSGTGAENILDKINKAVKKKFGHLNKDELPPKFNFPVGFLDIVAFAYLYKNLEFEIPFDITKPIYMNCQNKIFKAETFGFNLNRNLEKKLDKQFKLLYYKETTTENNFHSAEVVIKLISKSTTDEIIISTVQSGQTMKETYERINNVINLPEKDSVDVILLQIPKINFNIRHHTCPK